MPVQPEPRDPGRIRNVVILGSTGSIGTNTLDVIDHHPDRFRILGLAAHQNRAALQQQIDRYKPRVAALTGSGDSALAGTTIIDADDALTLLATHPEADVVVIATTGHAAIEPTIQALRAGKIVALANKETIVAAGELVMPIARSSTGALRPVDSEHCALWQCLGSDSVDATVRRLILTASGGPFRGWSAEQLAAVTREDALKHPNWDMGAKITIDSATLMNKGLELIEAHWLFACPYDQIDVIVHPQSIVHSCVEYVDGSILAQLGSHDMRLPIQYALTYPERAPSPATPLNLLELARLDFERPDDQAFPLLRVARDAGVLGGLYPAVLSAADVVAVGGFLAGKIGFLDIVAVIEQTLDQFVPGSGSVTLDAILEVDEWATQAATANVEKISNTRS
jgi:1-deoxy-D-xylulose-5-phosphate reductoisomerase